MKKFLRITAALAAVFAMVNFVACKDDDDDDGDEGNSFENTYWVLEDIVDEDDGYTLTSSAVGYVYIKDGTTGTIYETSDDTLEQADTELITGGVTASKEVAYDKDKTNNFTYTIEGSAIKITYKDEAGKDVNVTVTVAEDKTSFSLTDKDEETGEEYTMTYKKAAAAPKAATVTYTVKTESAEPVTYSFTGLGFADFPAGSLAGKVGDKNDKTTVISSIEEAYSDGSTYLPYLVANNSEGNELWDVKGAKIRCGSGHFKLRFAGDTKLASCINYNGGATTDITDPTFTAVYTGTSKTVDRYIMVPVTKNGKVTVSYKTVGSTKGSTTCQLGLFSKAGAAIKVDSVDTTTATEGTLTADVTAAAEEVYLVFSRNGAGGGGVDIYSIVVE